MLCIPESCIKSKSELEIWSSVLNKGLVLNGGNGFGGSAKANLPVLT